MKLYEISDNYINYLKRDPKLSHVYVNKDEQHKKRKYIGLVVSNIANNKNRFFIPFCSPKDKDFIVINGEKVIRNDSPIVVRIKVFSKKTHKYILKGSLQLGTMIPCPDSELKEYRIKNEQDIKYRNLVSLQMKFIKKNIKTILKKASLVYNQKINERNFKTMPKYLPYIIDFAYAIERCNEYISKKD